MLEDALIIACGVALVLGLGEVVINNAVEIAHRFRLSGTFIGLTILSIGTSIPEIVTHLVGSVTIVRQPETMDTISGLLFGANVGSDIFQQNLLLPLVGLLGTVVIRRSRLFSEVGALVGASLLLWLFSLDGSISRTEGAILVLTYLAYLVYLSRNNHLIDHLAEPPAGGTRRRAIISSILILVSFAVMAVVTEQVVGAATRMVERLPVSASLFGVLVLGVASALPELTTSLLSILRGERGIGVGILIGSNVTNPLLALGLGAAVSRYTVPEVVYFYDLPVKLATAVILFIFLWTREDLDRREAVALIALFFLYLAARPALFPDDFPIT